MAVNLAGGCRVSEMRDGEPITAGSVRIWNQIGRATGAQAISLRVMEFAPGLSLGIRNDDCDDILYVLGRVFPAPRELSTTDVDVSVNFLIDGQHYKVGSDTGLYIRPHQTLALENPGPDAVVIISAQCPDPAHATKFVNAPKQSIVCASERPPLIRLADRPAQPTANRWYRVLEDDEIGSTQVTQFVGSIPPGRAPDHFHDYEEVLFILKGKGRMWAGETKTAINEGSCIYLPKGQVHCVENTGEGELRLLGIFYPAGSPSVRYDA